jgi:hypothetical protein
MTYHRRNGADIKVGNHSLRAAYEYNISDKSNFNIAYTSFISPSGHGTNDVSGSYQTSRLDKHDRSYLHNVSAAYQSPFRTETGGGLYQLSCREPSVSPKHDRYRGQSFPHQRRTGRAEDFSITADQQHSLKRNWTLGYGASVRECV